MYSKQVLKLADELTYTGRLLATSPNHPLRHVEVGPNGQVFGNDFITERAPKVVATLKLFKDTIIPVMNNTIKKIDERIKQLTVEYNEQDLIKLYTADEKYTVLEKQDFIFREDIESLFELTFNDMTADDVINMPAFGNGRLKTMSILTPERTTYIYNTYIKSMNKESCKRILSPFASMPIIGDRLDTILVLLRIAHGEIVGTVFTPNTSKAIDALHNNTRLLINLYMDYVELLTDNDRIIGSVDNGEISIFPAGIQTANDDELRVRGLALTHSGYFTVDDMTAKDYGSIYENHLAIKSLQHGDKLHEDKRRIISEEIGKLSNLGTEFTSRLDENAIEDSIDQIQRMELVDNVREDVTRIFKSILFWKLPLGNFMDTVNSLLRRDHKLSMSSAVVLATAELIIDDIMLGVKSIEIGD